MHTHLVVGRRVGGRCAIHTGVSDAVSTLAWGVRHFALVFAGCVLAVAALFTFLVTRGPPTYEASALVVAQQLGLDLAALHGHAETTFGDGEVARAITAQFGNVGDSDSIVPDRVSLSAEQDSIALRVSGHDSSAQGAADLANAAATAFVDRLNLSGEGVGSFELQSRARPPARSVQELPAAVVVALGLAAGAIMGLAAVSLLLIVRRPVLDAADAAETTGIPVMGTISLPRVRTGRNPALTDIGGLIPVCRRLLALRPQVIVLTNAGRSARQRHQIYLGLAGVLGQVRAVRLLTEPSQSDPTSDVDPGAGSMHVDERAAAITLVEGPGPFDADPSIASAAVLLVPEGIAEHALRSAVARHLGGPGSDRLLMLRRAGVVSAENATPSSQPPQRTATSALGAASVRG